LPRLPFRRAPAAQQRACAEILARTASEQPVSDDNMGSEWRYSLGLE